jgi:2-polyprenyl-3-methyl-5-hydroxy-6-metoxy-1,4-benzoquinol methylase
MKQCPICGSTTTRQRWELAGYSIIRCHACGHQFVGNPPAVDALDAAYGEDYYRSAEFADIGQVGYADYLANVDKRIAGFRFRLEALEKYCAPGRILDVGCAVGLFLVAARDAGWNAVGYERSIWASQYGREHYGVDIVTGNSTIDIFPSASFDVITMWDVLEHIEDPVLAIENVAKWLVPGGILALSTVNAGSLGARLRGKAWRHFAPPHHLHYFNLRSLFTILTNSRFAPLAIRANGIFLDDVASNSGFRSLAKAINAVACHWRTRSVISRLNILDEIDVFARLNV